MNDAPPGRINSTRALERTMRNDNWLSESVPRVEHDHRAREARRLFEHLEQLLVPRHTARKYRAFRFLRLLVVSVAGHGRQANRSARSSRDRRLCDTFISSRLATFP